MKKAILIIFVLLAIAGCSAERREPDGEMRWIDVYYAAKGDEILTTEPRAIVAEDNITALIRDAIEQIKQKPTDSNLNSVLPEEAEIEKIKYDHGVAKIEFTEEYLSLSGIEKTIADCGILMTLTSNFWNIQALEISVNGEIVTPEIHPKDILFNMPKGQN